MNHDVILTLSSHRDLRCSTQLPYIKEPPLSGRPFTSSMVARAGLEPATRGYTVLERAQLNDLKLVAVFRISYATRPERGIELTAGYHQRSSHWMSQTTGNLNPLVNLEMRGSQ